MGIKHLIVPGLIGTANTEFLVTRGLGISGGLIPYIVQSNHLIGDISTMDRYTKGLLLTGFSFVLVDKMSGGAVTSGTVTCRVTIDGGTQTTVADTAVHEGNGQWSVDLSADEMDGDVISFQASHADAIPFHRILRTYG